MASKEFFVVNEYWYGLSGVIVLREVYTVVKKRL
jgi:hypothetical protein